MVNRMPLFRKDDVDLNYIVKGEAKGETLVLVHGFGTKLQGWHFQIEFFKNLMKVIALDNRGVGKSSRPDQPYTMDMFVEDLNALLEYLEIEEKIHLCGISMGGMIVQHYALKYPEKLKTLILCATSGRLEQGFHKMVDGLKKMEPLTPEEKIMELLPFLFSRKYARTLKKDAELFNFLKDDVVFIVPARGPTRIKDYENQASAIETHDTSNLLDKIEVPTLILGASKDRLVPLPNQQVLHEKIEGSRFEIIEGAGHGFTIEQPERVNEIIWEFIKQHSE
ncbi:MAG: alpha/beta hydrolase [Promethearchaeota archaeon]|nr:MAG: alpha/beta hydrolase [Candidatus Lokiarchaeota archaeon]